MIQRKGNHLGPGKQFCAILGKHINILNYYRRSRRAVKPSQKRQETEEGDPIKARKPTQRRKIKGDGK